MKLHSFTRYLISAVPFRKETLPKTVSEKMISNLDFKVKTSGLRLTKISLLNTGFQFNFSDSNLPSVHEVKRTLVELPTI